MESRKRGPTKQEALLHQNHTETNSVIAEVCLISLVTQVICLPTLILRSYYQVQGCTPVIPYSQHSQEAETEGIPPALRSAGLQSEFQTNRGYCKLCLSPTHNNSNNQILPRSPGRRTCDHSVEKAPAYFTRQLRP